MRLSEAIRLGSLAIQNPQRGDITSCAIGMACEAIGQRCMDAHSGNNYRALARNWPWTDTMQNGWLYSSQIMVMFDKSVCRGLMTLEALCDQVRAWEDELEAKGINVEQVTMTATPETTHEPAAEHAQHAVTK